MPRTSTTGTRAVAIPVDNTGKAPYLCELVRRTAQLTSLVYGWQTEDALRMVSPRRLLDEQGYVPFLFWAAPGPTDAVKEVTHCAISGLIWHQQDLDGRPERLAWLNGIRVEQGLRIEGWTAPTYRADAASTYVVTACCKLEPAICFEDLIVLSTDKPLSPKKERGYAVVRLPSGLECWYGEAQRLWDERSRDLPG
jgi:hypothetical protein